MKDYFTKRTIYRNGISIINTTNQKFYCVCGNRGEYKDYYRTDKFYCSKCNNSNWLLLNKDYTKINSYDKQLQDYPKTVVSNKNNTIIINELEYKVKCYDTYIELIGDTRYKEFEVSQLQKMKLDNYILEGLAELLYNKLKHPIDLDYKEYYHNKIFIKNLVQPSIYTIVKYGLIDLYKEEFIDYVDFMALKSRDILKIPNILLNTLQIESECYNKIDLFKFYRKMLDNNKCNVDEVYNIFKFINRLTTNIDISREFITYKDMETIFKLYKEYNYNLNSLGNYILEIYSHYYQGKSINDILIYLFNYIKMMNILKVHKIDKYPNKLLKTYDSLLQKFDNITNKDKADVYKRLKNKYKYLEQWSDIYCIKLPDSISEIISEGIYLNHCVGVYVNDVLMENVIILFLRDINKIGEPLLTVEVDSISNSIIQAEGYNHRKPTTHEAKFLHKWQTTLKANEVCFTVINTKIEKISLKPCLK